MLLIGYPKTSSLYLRIICQCRLVKKMPYSERHREERSDLKIRRLLLPGKTGIAMTLRTKRHWIICSYFEKLCLLNEMRRPPKLKSQTIRWKKIISKWDIRKLGVRKYWIRQKRKVFRFFNYNFIKEMNKCILSFAVFMRLERKFIRRTLFVWVRVYNYDTI